MVYERTHTRMLDELEPMRLNTAMPFAAMTFVVAGLASMGMPGFSGFVAELQVLIGAWRAFPTLAVLGGLGVLIGVAYTLRAIQKAFYSGAPGADTPVEPSGTRSGVQHSSGVAGKVVRGQVEPTTLETISVPERIGAAILMSITLLIGLYPRLLLDLIVPALNSPLMEKLVQPGRQ